jgi:hypothetical protein
LLRTGFVEKNRQLAQSSPHSSIIARHACAAVIDLRQQPQCVQAPSRRPADRAGDRRHPPSSIDHARSAAGTRCERQTRPRRCRRAPLDGAPALSLIFTQPLDPRTRYDRFIDVFEMPPRLGERRPPPDDPDAHDSSDTPAQRKKVPAVSTAFDDSGGYERISVSVR